MSKIYHSTGIDKLEPILRDGAVLSHVDKLARNYSVYKNVSFEEAKEYLVSRSYREERDLFAYFADTLRTTVEGSVEGYMQRGELVVLEFDVKDVKPASIMMFPSLSLDFFTNLHVQNKPVVKKILDSFDGQYDHIPVYELNLKNILVPAR